MTSKVPGTGPSGTPAFPFLHVTPIVTNTSSTGHGAQVATTKVVGVVGEGLGKSQSSQGVTNGNSNNLGQPA